MDDYFGNPAKIIVAKVRRGTTIWSKQRHLKSTCSYVDMSSADNVEEKLFDFYTQGSVEYSALLLASTVGVFSPFAILVSYSNRINIATEIVLGLIYLTFSVASGFSLTRPVGNVWLLYTVMPKQIRGEHNELASESLMCSTLTSEGIMNLKRYARLLETLVFLMPIIIYMLLLLSWIM